MARTAVTPTDLDVNGNAARPAGETIDSTLVTNGVVIEGAKLEELVLEVSNTAGTEQDVTVVAGAYPPALASGQGDLTVAVAATTGVQLIGPLESGRFAQSNGDLYVDFESGTTGTLRVYRAKRS